MLRCETSESSLVKDSLCGSVLRILTAPRQLVIINNSFYINENFKAIAGENEVDSAIQKRGRV